MKEKQLVHIKEPIFFLFTCVKEGRPYINKLFDSLLEQTCFNFVHYIYEDGSLDPISNLIDDYKKKAPYEVIYEKNATNIGLNMATKHCIEKCFCPYFIWIDCDNWVDVHFFEELEKVARKNPKAVLLRTILYKSRIDSTNVYSHFNRKKVFNNAKKHDQIKMILMDDRNYGYCFFAVKKEYLGKNFTLLNDKYFANDTQVLIQTILTRLPSAFSAKAIGYYLSRDDSEGHIIFLKNANTNHVNENIIRLLKETDNCELSFVRHVFCSLALYRFTLRLIDEKKYQQALNMIKFKRTINRQHKLSKRFYCREKIDLYWVLKIYYLWLFRK